MNNDDCSDVTACDPGFCIDALDAFACDCPPGYYGDGTAACKLCDAIANCSAVTCTSASDETSVACDSGYHVENGVCVNTDDCSGVTACGPGYCIDALDAHTCDCPRGWYGDGTATCSACDAIANCSAVTCTSASNETCVTCDSGYHVENGRCVNEDDCAGVTACGPGSCIDALDAYTCDCPRGWYGDGKAACTACDTIAKCSAVTCTSASNETCITCDSGYHIEDGVCLNNDDCSGVTACDPGSCIDALDAYTCDCPNGHYGDGTTACTACDAIDNCTAITCSSSMDETCIACASGYELDGSDLGCIAVDEEDDCGDLFDCDDPDCASSEACSERMCPFSRIGHLTSYGMEAHLLGPPRGLVSKDLNDDRRADLAVATSGQDVLCASSDAGSHALSMTCNLVLTGGAWDLAAGDLTGDGVLDLVVTVDDGSIQVFAGDGDGQFSPSWQLELPDGGARTALGDWDQDGLLDLAVAHVDDETEMVLLINGGSGDFSIEPGPLVDSVSDLVAGDFDGDDDLDLLATTGDGLATFVNEAGTFTPATFMAFPSPSTESNRGRARTGDFDSNGQDEAVWVGNDDVVRFASNDRITTLGRLLEGVLAVGDLDKDGDEDLVGVATSGGPENLLWLAINDGTGDFVDKLVVWIPIEAEAIGMAETGDFDGDGYPDLAVSYHGVHPVSSVVTTKIVIYANSGAVADYSDASSDLIPDACQ